MKLYEENKKLIRCVLFAVILFSLTVGVSAKNIYSYDEESQELLVYSTNGIVEKCDDFEYRDSVEKLEFGDNVTEIAEGAFENWTSVNYVELPKSLKVLHRNAFKGCTSLWWLGINSDIVNYSKFDKDSKEIWAASVNNIYDFGSKSYNYFNNEKYNFGKSIFGGAPVTWLVFGENVKNIGAYAFSQFENVDTIIFDGDMPACRENAFASPDAIVWYPPVNKTWQKAGETWQSMTALPDWETGDVDFSGEVDSADAIRLSRFVAGWDVTINVICADFDNDAEITPRDCMILARHLADWKGYDDLYNFYG